MCIKQNTKQSIGIWIIRIIYVHKIGVDLFCARNLHGICTAFRPLILKRKWWFACICAWNMHTYIDNLDFFKFSVPYIDILFLFICTKTLIFPDIWRKFYCAYTVHIPCVVHGSSLKPPLAWYMSDSFVYINPYSYISNI